MDDRDENLTELAIKEKELQIKAKELELQERELRLKEEKAAAAQQRKEAVNNVLKKALSSKKAGDRGFFSLHKEENLKIWSYSGILTRKYFLAFQIIFVFVSTIFFNSSSFYFDHPYFEQKITFALSAISILISLFVMFAIVKRCRDCGISPWWMLLFLFIPFTSIYLLFARSKEQTVEQIRNSSSGTGALVTIVLIFVLLAIGNFHNALSQ